MDGEPCSYRDRKDFAIEAAEYLSAGFRIATWW